MILVGHSYGGAVITEAGNNPKVAGLVYVAGWVPDKGESVSTLLEDSAGGRPAPANPPAQGWLALPRRGEVPRRVRGRRQPRQGGVHG